MKKMALVFSLFFVAQSFAGNVRNEENWRIENDTGYSNYSSLINREELVVECMLGFLTVNVVDDKEKLEIGSQDPDAVVIIDGKRFNDLREFSQRKQAYQLLSQKKGYVQLQVKSYRSSQHPTKGLSGELRRIGWDLSNCKE